MESPSRRYTDLALYRRLFAEARPYLPHLVGLFVLALLAAPLALLMPLPVKVVVDSVLSDKPLPGFVSALLPSSVTSSGEALLLAAAIAIVVIALLVQLQDLLSWIVKTWIGERLLLGFRARLFDHMQRLSLSFHKTRQLADSIYRLQFDAQAIQSVAIQGVIPFATALVKVLVLLYVTWRIDRSIALVALAGGPVLFGLTELYRGRLRRRWTAARAHESAAMSAVQESLSAVQVVKAFGQEARERRRYEQRAEASLEASLSAVRAHGTFDLLVGLATGVGAAAILWLGARHVMDGSLTLGELLLVMAYLSQLFQPLREVGTRMADLQKALASAERVLQVMDEAPEAEERADARSLDRARGEIELVGVTFGYGDGPPVLDDVSLRVPAGARVGIAGKTGSGKSTLLSLLPRFYDPRRGQVLLDGVDVAAYRLADLRRQFAIVLQEPFLFSTTIRENIAYGRPEATEAEILQAAKDAAAHEFVSALPEGYDTQVGERGSRLSGGERQRVALARAFLRDAPILILDEPTSSLDTGTESAVMEALERLMRGRTTFIIAHRLRTLQGCDVRLRVGDGRVEMRGEDLSDVELDGDGGA